LKSVICYLIVNRIPNLPKLAIRSALENSDSDIYVGYLNESDLDDLPRSNRLHFINLTSAALERGLSVTSSDYIDFSNDYFFSLVQLKWDLFKEVSAFKHIDSITYLDLDVVLLKNLTTEFEKTFQENSTIEVLVQDFTFDPSRPRLCMGVFAFKCDDFARLFIDECAKIHSSGLLENPRFGDDDVITQYYVANKGAVPILRLPQQSFPVGNLFNIFMPFSPLKGLRPDKPYVFHANFVVGNLKKTLLLTIVLAKGDKKYLFKVFYLYTLLVIATGKSRLISLRNKIRGFS